MDLSILLAKQILSMILMIAAGFGAARAKIFPPGTDRALSTLTLYIICPCLMFSSMQMDYNSSMLNGFLLAAAAAALVNAFFILLSKLTGRIIRADSLERASMIYSNAGNLILPLISEVLGKEYLFYAGGYLAVQTVFFWTHGLALISGHPTKNLRKILTNPNIDALILGLIFFFLPIRLPGVLEQTIEKIGNTIGPISMIGIGIIMSGMPLARAITDRRAWLICILRLVLFPAAVIVLIALTGITRRFAWTGMVLIATELAASAPTAVNIAQTARIYDQDAAGAGQINVLSTILCIFTMPLMLMFYQALCM